MTSTSVTLLERVRNPRDGRAWREFFRLYFPVLKKYARRRGLAASEADDIAQDCMESLAEHMPGFCYSPGRGRFKSYLRTMVDNRIANRRRRKHMRQARTGELEALPAGEAARQAWDEVWLREHLAYSIARLESRCSNDTVNAFRLYALQDWPVEKVCAALGLSANQVYLAKSRMIRRLRQELAALVGDVL